MPRMIAPQVATAYHRWAWLSRNLDPEWKYQLVLVQQTLTGPAFLNLLLARLRGLLKGSTKPELNYPQIKIGSRQQTDGFSAFAQLCLSGNRKNKANSVNRLRIIHGT